MANRLLSIIMVIAVLSMIFPISSADGYFFQYLNHMWDKPPLVCFVDSNNKWASLNAMKLWNESLEKLGDEWKVKYMFGYDINKCNIIVKYVDESKWNGAYVYGQLVNCTHFIGVNNFCNIEISKNREGYPASPSDWTYTVAHEIGHGFGLHHIKAETPQEFFSKPCIKSLMADSPCLREPVIKEFTLGALKCKYGEDGWGGVNHKKCTVYKVDIKRLD